MRFLLRLLKEQMTVVTILPFWPRKPWFPLAIHLSKQHPTPLPAFPHLLVQGRFLHPNIHKLELWALAVERLMLESFGCSSGVIATLLKARKPTTNKVYAKIWDRFALLVTERGLNPAAPPLAAVLDFLQSGLDMGLILSSLKVQISAISAITKLRWVEEPLIRQFFPPWERFPNGICQFY